MKKQILVLAMSLMTLTAKAGNEGPQATPAPPATVIAEVSRGNGFFSPPTAPRGEAIQVYSDGRAVKVIYFSDRTEAREIATLSPNVTNKLIELVRSVQAGEMLDPNPTSPGCQDGPTTSSAAYPTPGKRVVLALKQSCKEYKKSNLSNADDLILRVLGGLSTLGNL